MLQVPSELAFEMGWTVGIERCAVSVEALQVRKGGGGIAVSEQADLSHWLAPRSSPPPPIEPLARS